jgi:hypothetical protein
MIVEDGTVVDNANSYVTVAAANAYHSDRGNAAWTGTDAVKEAALIKATDYIEQKYNQRWIGYLTEVNQPLSWPRAIRQPNTLYNDYLTGVVPEKLKQAVCILALEALSSDLNPVQDRAVKREKVDVIEVEYMDNALSGKSRPAVDGLLREYLTGSRYNAPIMRV